MRPAKAARARATQLVITAKKKVTFEIEEDPMGASKYSSHFASFANTSSDKGEEMIVLTTFDLPRTFPYLSVASRST